MPGVKVEERRLKAVKNAQLAYKLIDKKENYQKLLDAVENKDKKAFLALCLEIGIGDDEANELWRLIKYESGKESVSICW
jgi:hypothetical protein